MTTKTEKAWAVLCKNGVLIHTIAEDKKTCVKAYNAHYISLPSNAEMEYRVVPITISYEVEE